DDGQGALRLAVQSGGRLLPGASTPPRHRSRHHRGAAPRAPAGIHRPYAWTTASGNDRTGRVHANHFAAGAVAGGCPHPDTGHQAMVTPTSSGAAMSTVQESIRKPIDSERWPAVAKVPSGPLAATSAIIADRLLQSACARLPLRLVYPD